MKLYYLDRKLEREEVDIFSDTLKLSEPVEQVRIPYVLPAPDPNGGYHGRPIIDGRLIEKHLLRAGILLDRGEKISLVIPKDRHWYESLISAIVNLTGRYSCLIQTEEQRSDIDKPRNIRIVDMEELIGRNKRDI